jgi:methylated-DNA-[protein]-cysteine S-methyltransferase
MSSFVIRSTFFGQLALLWSIFDGRPKISRVLLSTPAASAPDRLAQLFPDAVSASCPEIRDIAEDIAAFLEGEEVRFPLEPIRMDLCSEFQRTVLSAEHNIPRGSVSTYQRIALYLGKPKSARAVGSALANNPFPIIIPCHRAIRSDRSLGGYQGGIEMKRKLLEMEGIHFKSAGRVAVTDLFY